MKAPKAAAAATVVAIAAIAGALPGCKHPDHTPAASASAAASAAPAASIPHAIPVPQKVIAKAVNPRGVKPYSGPTGTIAGTITITGDPPPAMPKVLKIIPAECDRAPAMYGKLFRVDSQNHLADALVTVTGYDAFIPAKTDKKVVVGRGCAWNTRTIAMTFGEKLEVKSRGRTAYVPELQGAHMAAQMVAIPGGSAITLFPNAPGRYQLLDSMHLFMKANVLVVSFSTFDVTGPNGAYEIRGIPVQKGEVTVTAFLPQTMEHVERKVKVEPGKTTRVDLQLVYKKPAEPVEPAPSPKPDKNAPVIR